MARHNAQGRAAEERALHHLQARGLRLLDRNFRSRGGEIDLIMRQGNLLVFVEVRYRQNSNFGSPFETVTTTKQRRLITTAAHYLQQQRLDLPCRFDVVGITGAQLEQVEWIQDAFQPQ
jgi:putative endonuclease